MRHFEIINGAVGLTPATRARIARLEDEASDRDVLIPTMYGHGALDREIEAEELEAKRLANAKVRAEIRKIQAEIEAENDPLDDALTRAKARKAEAEAAATLADL